MTDWEEAIKASTFAFVEALERRGFHAIDQALTGEVGEGAGAVRVEIRLPDDFPFAPPVVVPPEDFPRSWHRERNGSMCLYPADGRDDLPWLVPDDFLELVQRWLTETRSGWVGDFPDLDLERYFKPSDEPLVVYGDLDHLGNKFVQFRRGGRITRLTGAGSIPKGRSAGRNRAFGYITDIGEPAVPPSNWDDLKRMIPAADSAAIETRAADGRFSYLVVRYSRGGIGAAAVLVVEKAHAGNLSLASVRSASEASATLTLRAGKGVSRLAEARVAVVGVGAIGSFVCDLLARSGIGSITAIDPDIVRPGNLIRHAASPDSVGLGKPAAIKGTIEARPYNSTVVDTDVSLPPRKVMSLFNEHDLVIDATASASTSNLLAKAAIAAGHRLLSVCVQEEGGVVRVDVIPPFSGNAIPAITPGPQPAREDLRFEAGCGDPVSQTPAYAVVEAASLTARHATALLTGRPVSEAGTVHDYR